MLTLDFSLFTAFSFFSLSGTQFASQFKLGTWTLHNNTRGFFSIFSFPVSTVLDLLWKKHNKQFFFVHTKGCSQCIIYVCAVGKRLKDCWMNEIEIKKRKKFVPWLEKNVPLSWRRQHQKNLRSNHFLISSHFENILINYIPDLFSYLVCARFFYPRFFIHSEDEPRSRWWRDPFRFTEIWYFCLLQAFFVCL